MLARDVMTNRIISVGPQDSVRDIARTMLDQHISAVPVMDSDGTAIGMVSEGDLMRRPESDTDRPASWWLALVSSPEERALKYIKTHGKRAMDIMTSPVITVEHDASLDAVADVLERNRIKRVVVIRDGKPIGIVSRANLLHGLVTGKIATESNSSDREIRKAIVRALEHDAGVRDEFINVTVADGTVHLWGVLLSSAEREAAHLVAESTDGVRGIEDHLSVLPPQVRAALWAQ